MTDQLFRVDEAAETVLDLFRERRDEIAREIDYPELDLEGAKERPSSSFLRIIQYRANFTPLVCSVHRHLFEWLIAQDCVR